MHTQVWLHDLLPAGLSRDIKAVRRRTVPLEGVHKGQAGRRAVLRCTLVDTDPRREMYQTPFLDGDFAEDVGEEADSGSEAGGGRSSQDEQRAMVQRLQSTTEGLSQAELRHKAMLTGTRAVVLMGLWQAGGQWGGGAVDSWEAMWLARRTQAAPTAWPSSLCHSPRPCALQPPHSPTRREVVHRLAGQQGQAAE